MAIEKNANHKEAEMKAPVSSALEVAKAILKKARKENGPITNMKLQKLLYFTYGWAFPAGCGPLFGDQIQAWRWGPVVPIVYHAYKRFGSDEIDIDQIDDETLLNVPDVQAGSKVDSLIDLVLKTYGKRTASDMSAISHVKGSAWRDTIEGSRDDKGNYPQFTEIKPELIQSKFLSAYRES